METWVNRLRRCCLITAISMELVRFDMQAQDIPDIQGQEYQQGTLAGYETREYVLEKWKRTCAYCGKADIPIQVEHIQARANGGTNRISNLCVACETCNRRKGTQDITVFLAKKPDLLKQILAQAKAPLKDTAAVNATRWALFERLKETGLSVECGSGGRTKFNRVTRHLEKTHWLGCGVRGGQYATRITGESDQASAHTGDRSRQSPDVLDGENRLSTYRSESSQEDQRVSKWGYRSGGGDQRHEDGHLRGQGGHSGDWLIQYHDQWRRSTGDYLSLLYFNTSMRWL
jgi:5-methylcytosine-specific restriction endonuclease McrA